MLAGISLFNKSGDILTGFHQKRSTFLYIGLTFAYFRLSGKYSVFNALFTHTVSVSKTKLHFLKK